MVTTVLKVIVLMYSIIIPHHYQDAHDIPSLAIHHLWSDLYSAPSIPLLFTGQLYHPRPKVCHCLLLFSPLARG